MTARLTLLFLVVFFTSCRTNTEAPTAQQPNLQFSNATELLDAFVWDAEQEPMISAHRGGPEPGFPENCIPTFERVLSYTPAILEMDVEITKDSVLIMMHDQSLDRTTTGTGKLLNKNWEEMQELRLKDNDGNVTDFKIPTLEEVLKWGRGKAILSLDIKRNTPYELVVDAVEALQAESYVMIIVYNVKAAQKIHSLNPNLLISVGIRNEKELDMVKASGLPFKNLVAFTGTTLKSAEFYDQLHQLGISCILGTLGNLDQQAAARGDQLYLQHRKLGVDIFATDRPRAVAEVLY